MQPYEVDVHSAGPETRRLYVPEVPSVTVLAARMATLRGTAEVLGSAFHQPVMKARVTDAASNLGEAQRRLGDPRLEDSQDCRRWVDALLRIAARRLSSLEDPLQTYGPDATGLSA